MHNLVYALKEYIQMHNLVQFKMVFTSSEKPIRAFSHLSEDSLTWGGTIPDILPETVPVLMPQRHQRMGSKLERPGKLPS